VGLLINYWLIHWLVGGYRQLLTVLGYIVAWRHHFESFTVATINTTGVTSGARTADPSGAPEFTPVFSGVRVTRSLVLCVCFVDLCLSFYLFFWPWCCLSFDLRILITPLVSTNSSWRLVNPVAHETISKLVHTIDKNDINPLLTCLMLQIYNI